MSDVRARLLERLGRLPNTPAVSRPSIERQFVWHGVEFERWTWPGARDTIPAWFLRPSGARGPLPTIVAVHPHGRQFEVGKSMVAGLVGEASRAYGLAAAQAGFAVLAPDLPGFEERRPPLAVRKTSYALQGEHYERLLAMQALVQGETLQGWMLVDLSQCIDVLVQDDRVDAARIGIAGQSLGGQEVVFAMLYDERYRAGVISCGMSRVRLLVDRNLSHNMALYVPALLPDLDFETLVPALAPRPLFVIAGERDPIYPVEGVREVESRARSAYERAGAAARLHYRYFDGPHDLPPEALEAALHWLRGVL